MGRYFLKILSWNWKKKMAECTQHSGEQQQQRWECGSMATQRSTWWQSRAGSQTARNLCGLMPTQSPPTRLVMLPNPGARIVARSAAAAAVLPAPGKRTWCYGAAGKLQTRWSCQTGCPTTRSPCLWKTRIYPR